VQDAKGPVDRFYVKKHALCVPLAIVGLDPVGPMRDGTADLGRQARPGRLLVSLLGDECCAFLVREVLLALDVEPATRALTFRQVSQEFHLPQCAAVVGRLPQHCLRQAIRSLDIDVVKSQSSWRVTWHITHG
jgi:hypothetical protein